MSHVCIFIQSLANGGAERVTITLAKYLHKKKYNVTVITMADDKNDFYLLPDGVNRIYLDMAFENQGYKKLTANFERISRLREELKKIEPDILIGMMTSAAVLSILACLGLKTKVIVSERNFPGRKKINLFWALLRRLTYRFADGHVAQTQKTLEWLLTHTKARNVHVIPNSVSWPIPTQCPIIDPANFLTDQNKIILAVGTKLTQKGFDLLLKAFSKIGDTYPEWRLVIIGIDREKNIKDYERLIHLVQKHNLSDQIILIDKVGNIGSWYERANIFVLSSRYEGFPNVLIEAMAAGCACVAFDCDTGPRDIIEHKRNGLLVSPENTDELSETISHLIENNELHTILSTNAILAREKFSEENVLIKWEKIIKSILLTTNKNN